MPPSGPYRAQIGDFERAFAELQRAQELDPLSGEISAYLGLVPYCPRQYDDSITQLRQAITFDPTFVPSYLYLAWVLAANGETQAALDACRETVERQANAWTTLALARAQALAGDHVAAASTMERIGEQAARFVSGYDRAAVHAALGHTDEAFAALENGHHARAEWMGYLKVDPQMDTLRRDPRYATLLRRLDLYIALGSCGLSPIHVICWRSSSISVRSVSVLRRGRRCSLGQRLSWTGLEKAENRRLGRIVLAVNLPQCVQPEALDRCRTTVWSSSYPEITARAAEHAHTDGNERRTPVAARPL